MKWRNVINSQKYSECQLVAALNAYYCLTGKNYCRLGDATYEYLVDLVGARHGGAICIEKAHRVLGLRREPHPTIDHWSLLDEWPQAKMPIEVRVWHKRTGFHAALIIGYSAQCRAIRVANFCQVTTAEGWMFVEDLYQYRDHLSDQCFHAYSKRRKR